MRNLIIIPFIIFFHIGCNRIETNDTLKKSDIKYIQSLGLLDSNEKIIKFYSNFKTRLAGNFFTNKRIATYWIDERDQNNPEIHNAYYSEVKAIDTVHYGGLTYSPYILVTKKDDSKFKVYIEGSKKSIGSFLDNMLKTWKSNNTK
jgi:hypothetical protein